MFRLDDKDIREIFSGHSNPQGKSVLVKPGVRISLDNFWAKNDDNLQVGYERIVLKTTHNKFLCAEPNGKLVANRSAAKIWERFTPEPAPGNKISLKSCHNKYVCSENNGNMVANRDRAQLWEHFEVWVISPGTFTNNCICGITLKSHLGKNLCFFPEGHIRQQDHLLPWEILKGWK